MATRSRIAIENQDETVNSIYCHWDGYVDGVGKTLFEHYDQEKLTKLIKLGDISSLGEAVEPIGKHTFESPEENVTVAYHRDRGEDLHFESFNDVEDLFENGFGSGVEYVYCLTRHGIWLVGRVESPMVNYLQNVLEEEGA